jgi:hypothetical protein
MYIYRSVAEKEKDAREIIIRDSKNFRDLEQDKE